jgi:glycosyltransferase involved in cell wall biosynthesis
VSKGRVVIDLVAPQSPSYRERGIARHGLNFAQALVERHGDLIERILLHPELPPAGGLDPLIASGKVGQGLEGVGLGGIFHLTSAFEPEIPMRALWPRQASVRRMRLVVTLYDLIPDVFPEMYLVDPGLRRRWRACRELVRVADHVLTLSHSATDDVVRLLGVPPERVTVIGAGCDPRFQPAASRPAAMAAARSVVAGLGEHFVVYNGAIDPRKNLDRLIEAYASLPCTVRDHWQLVLVCRAGPLQRNHYLVMAERLGVAGRVLLPGFVPDDTLVHLYQSADLSVFPSLYEGYGLPVVEARACGAPVVAGDNSSLRELVTAEARFDAMDPAAIARSMAAALTDEGLRSRLLAEAAAPPPTWGEVADRTATVYRNLLDTAAAPGGTVIPGWRRRPQVAVISPLPPWPSPAAAWGLRLADALTAAGGDVDLFPDGGTGAVSRGRRLAAFASLDHWRGGYDLVVCTLGADPAHGGAVGLLHRGELDPSVVVVVAHQVDLRRAYQGAADRGVLPDGLAATVQAMYPGVAPDVGAHGRLTAAQADRHGMLLARHAVRAAGRFVVFDESQALRVRADTQPLDAGIVEVMAPADPAIDGSFEHLADALLAPARQRLAPR